MWTECQIRNGREKRFCGLTFVELDFGIFSLEIPFADHSLNFSYSNDWKEENYIFFILSLWNLGQFWICIDKDRRRNSFSIIRRLFS